MKLQQKSNGQEIDIKDFYAVKIGAIWEQLKREHFSFWALNAYFFFEYVRPQSIYTSIDILPWGQVSLLLAIVGALVDPSVKWVGNTINKLMISFLLVILLSVVFSRYPMPSWTSWSLFINWLLVYFLFISVINNERRFFIFMLAFLLYNFKMSQHGLYVWASRGFSFTKWGLTGPPGWFQNSGEYAIEMLIFLPLSVAFVLGLRHYWGSIKRWFFYLMPVTSAFTVMGCSSRGAQLSLALIALWVILRSKARIKALIAVAVLGYGLYAFLPEQQMERFQDMGDDMTSLQRLAYWDAGLQIMNENPVLGIGYSSWFLHMHARFPQGVGPMQWIQLPHNIFVEVGAELGYLGLFVVFLMILTVFILNSSTRRMAAASGDRWIGYTAFALDAGLFGFLVAGFFVTVFYYPFFWVQMAMTVALYTITKQKVAEARKTLSETGDTVRPNALQPRARAL